MNTQVTKVVMGASASYFLYDAYQMFQPSSRVYGTCSYQTGGQSRTYQMTKGPDIARFVQEMELKRTERCSGTCTMQARVIFERTQPPLPSTSEGSFLQRNYTEELVIDPPQDSTKTCDAYAAGVAKVRGFAHCIQGHPLQRDFRECMQRELR